MIEKDVEVVSNSNTLRGTLCLPSDQGPFPSVLMVHGSGPLDCNENVKKGSHLNLYNTLAHHLAGIGIASLRYDKRGCGESTGDYYAAGHSDLLADAISCFNALGKYDSCERDKRFILGHSEGCLIGAEMCLLQQAVAGLIVLTPHVEKTQVLAIKQAEWFQRELDTAPGIKGAFNRVIAKVIGGPLVNQRQLFEKLEHTSVDTIRFKLKRIPAKWVREMLAIDPGTIYSQILCPILAVGGAKDLHCNPSDVEKIASLALGTVATHIIENLTHYLRFDYEEPSLHNYKNLLKNRNVEPIVLQLIEDWLLQVC